MKEGRDPSAHFMDEDERREKLSDGPQEQSFLIPSAGSVQPPPVLGGVMGRCWCRARGGLRYEELGLTLRRPL